MSPEEINYAKQLMGNKNQDEVAFAKQLMGVKNERAIQPAQKMIQQEQPNQPKDPMSSSLGSIGGVVGKALEVLDRPRGVLVSGARSLFGNAPAGDMWKAAKGEIHPSWTDFLNDVNPPDKPKAQIQPVFDPKTKQWTAKSVVRPNSEKSAANHAIGFVMDIGLDPLNLTGGNVVTKSGKASKVLSSIAKTYGDDVARGLLNHSDDAIKVLREAGVSEKIIDVALKAKAPLAKTLPEQAKAGQWAAAKFGALTTPKAVNVPVAKVLDKVSHALPNVPIINKFINKTGVDSFDEGIKDIDLTHNIRQNKIMDTGREARKVLDKSDFGDVSSAAWYERGGKGATAEQNVMKHNIYQLNAEQVADMKARGIPFEQINEKGYYYVPHIETPEAASNNIFSKIKAKFSGPSNKTPQALHRRIKWITDPSTGKEVLDDVQRYAAENGVDEASLKFRQASVDEINKYLGGNKFRGDLAEASTVGALRNESAIHGADQLDFFLDEGRKATEGMKAGEIPKDYRPPRILVPRKFRVVDDKNIAIATKISELQNTPMPPAMARMVESRWKMIAEPEKSVQEMKKLYDGYMSAWKRYTLFMFPEYHSRNMVGDIWNGWMNGWKAKDIPADIAQATKLQIKNGVGQTVKTGLYGNISGENLYKAARDYGVIGTGQWSEIADVMAPVESAKGKSILKKVKEQAWDLKGPAAVGEFLENNRRLAFFTRLVKDGDTFEDAAKKVAGALYDYNDLTDTERQIRRFGVPFYTWYRKNIPAQFKNLIEHPGKVSVLPKAKAAIESYAGGNVPEDTRPEWMRREFSVHTGQDEKGRENFSMLGNYFPTTDLFKFGGKPADVLTNTLSNSSPLIKVPTELALNKNVFRGNTIDSLRDDDKGVAGELVGNERTNFLGRSMPTTVQKLSEMLPVTRALSTLDRMNPYGIFDQRAPDEQGKTRPYHTELDTGAKVLKTLTGLKNYPVDMRREQMYRMMDLKRQTENEAGINLANIRAAYKRAVMEGDTEGMKKYEALIPVLEEKMKKMQDNWAKYNGGK